MLIKLKKFIYLAFLLLSSPVSASAFENFDCLGTEPFWKLSIAEDKFTFIQDASHTITLPAVEPKPPENMKIEHMQVFRTKANNKDAIIILQKQSCTDGMSEDIFAYEGLIIFPNKVFHGCCTKKLLLTN